MPTISSFYGIFIRMYFNDHEPAHFHMGYAEYKATISICELQIMSGELPGRVLELVKVWAEIHQQALTRNWELCQNKSLPESIPPLT